jgi:outer membrane protein assembly factor BamB
VDSRLDRRQALYAGVGVAAAGLAGGAGWLWTRSGSSGAGTPLWRARGRPHWGLIAGGGVVYVLGSGLRYPSAVADGILLLMPGASGSAHVLAALSAHSGRPAWQRALTGKPLEAATCNETFLVAAADGTLYAIAARTGSVSWKHRLASSPAGLAADPVIGVAYAADRTGTLYAFRV